MILLIGFATVFFILNRRRSRYNADRVKFRKTFAFGLAGVVLLILFFGIKKVVIVEAVALVSIVVYGIWLTLGLGRRSIRRSDFPDPTKSSGYPFVDPQNAPPIYDSPFPHGGPHHLIIDNNDGVIRLLEAVWKKQAEKDRERYKFLFRCAVLLGVLFMLVLLASHPEMLQGILELFDSHTE